MVPMNVIAFILVVAAMITLANSVTTVSTFPELQSAIFASTYSSIIVSGNILFPNEIILPDLYRVNIQGEDNNAQLITNGGNRLFRLSLNSSLSLSSLILTSTQISNVLASNGGFIYSNGTVTLTNVKMSNGAAACGSALYAENSTVSLINVTVSANMASSSDCGGAIFVSRSVLNVSHCSFSNNTAVTGAAIFVGERSKLLISSSKFLANTITGSTGGAVYTIHSEADIQNSLFQDNFAIGNGGGLYFENPKSSKVTHSQFIANNASVNGAGIFLLTGKLTVSGCAFTGGFADNGGGAMAVSGGTLRSHSNTFLQNSASNAGGSILCFDEGHLTVIASSFDLNTATSYGGSINAIQQCQVNIQQSIFANGIVPLTDTAMSAGGDISCTGASIEVGFSDFSSSFAGQGSAIYAFNCPLKISFSTFSNLTAQDSTIYAMDGSNVNIMSNHFVNNSATSYSNGVSCSNTEVCHSVNNTFSYGLSFELGTFYVDTATAVVNNCHFLRNVATGAGAAIFGKSATVFVYNSTFVENSARTYGAAIASEISSTFNIKGCFFANNTATNGGAVYGFFGSQFEISNSTFHANKAADTGGAIYLADTSYANITASHFHHNFAALGAAFYISSDAEVEMSSVHTHTNRAGFAGGVALVSNMGRFSARDSHFMNNSAALGGVAAIQYISSGYFDNCYMLDNKATALGGALYVVVSSTLDVHRTQFSGNIGNLGAGVLELQLSTANFSSVTCSHNNGAYGAVAQTTGAKFFTYQSTYANNGDGNVYEGGVFEISSGSFVVSVESEYANNVAAQGGVMALKLSSFLSQGDVMYGCKATTSGCILATQNSQVTLQNSIVRDNVMPVGAIGGVITVSNGNFTTWNSSFSNNVVQTQGVVTLLTSDVSLHQSFFHGNIAQAESSRASAVFLGCAVPCDITARSIALINGTLFHTNEAKFGLGGALAIGSFPGRVSVTHSSFVNNHATNGGGMAVEGTTVSVASSFFDKNVALEGGGGIFWDYNSDLPTTIDSASCVALDNRAAYGRFKATNLVKLFVESVVSTQVSGQTLSAPIYVELHDAYGQIVTNTSSLLSAADTTVYVAVFNNTGVLRGSSIVAPINGTAKFSQIVLVGEPGGTLILTFSVAASLVPLVYVTVPLRACVPGEITLGVAGTPYSICQPCPAGTYSFFPSDTTCHTCPQNAYCPGRNRLDVTPGYWRTDDTSASILACPVPQVCNGGYNTSTQCAEGQTGPYCSVCQPGYAESSTGVCYACRSSHKLTTELVSTFLFLALLIIFLVVWKKSKQLMRFYAKLNQTIWQNRRIRTLRVKGKILLSFAQIVYQLGPAFNIVFPVNFLTYLNFYSFLSLNLAFLPDVDCIIRTNFYTDLLVSTISPIVLYALIAVGLQVMVAHARRLNQRNPYYTPDQSRSDTIAALFVISYFVLISVSTKIFEVFQCETFDNGESYLVADYSINCASSEYHLYRVYGSVMIMIYPLGIPFAYAAILIRHRHKINPSWRQVIDVKEKALVSKRVIQREKIKVRKTFDEIRNLSLLYDSYIPRRWYFEIFDCVRRLFLGAIPVLILRGSSLQIVIVLLISLASTGFFMSAQPYIHKHDNKLAIMAQWSITFVVLASLVIKVQALEGDTGNNGLGVVLIILNIFVVIVSVLTTMMNTKVKETDDKKNKEKAGDGSGRKKSKLGGEADGGADLNFLGFIRGDDDSDEDNGDDDDDDSAEDEHIKRGAIDDDDEEQERDEDGEDDGDENDTERGGSSNSEGDGDVECETESSNAHKKTKRKKSQVVNSNRKEKTQAANPIIPNKKGIVGVGYAHHNRQHRQNQHQNQQQNQPQNQTHQQQMQTPQPSGALGASAATRPKLAATSDDSDDESSEERSESSSTRRQSLESDPELDDAERDRIRRYYGADDSNNNNNNNNNNNTHNKDDGYGKGNQFEFFAQRNPLHYATTRSPSSRIAHPPASGTSEGIDMQTFSSNMTFSPNSSSKNNTVVDIDSDDET